MENSRFKFRAWDDMRQEMYYGYDIHTPVPTGYAELEVMQYTGLKDKNGVEIYEGDIVAFLDGSEWSTEGGYDCEEYLNHGEVFFDEEHGRYDVTNKESVTYEDVFEGGLDLVVLGNIYQHSHLLEEGT